MDFKDKVESSMKDVVETNILPGPEEDTFFCIIIKKPEDVFNVMVLLNIYDPQYRVLINYDDEPNSVVLIVYKNLLVPFLDASENFRLTEMACQMNYYQVGSMTCPVCEKEGLDVCGHLTFKV